jgi:hypothetical protein
MRHARQVLDDSRLTLRNIGALVDDRALREAADMVAIDTRRYRDAADKFYCAVGLNIFMVVETIRRKFSSKSIVHFWIHKVRSFLSLLCHPSTHVSSLFISAPS